MKKIVLVFTVLVSSFGFGQSDTNPELQKMIDSAVTELDNWKSTTKTFKTDGDDAAAFGLLENLFLDADVKYMYARINPAIAELEINNRDLNIGGTCSFDKWINSITVLDTSNYKFIYRYVTGTSSNEALYIFDINGNLIRKIIIYYYNDSLRSIFDSNQALFK